MKVMKVILSVAAVASILGATAAPAFANVIHLNGTTGKPIAHGSNSGSVQAQQHRSATGTRSKFTSDGWAWIED